MFYPIWLAGACSRQPATLWYLEQCTNGKFYISEYWQVLVLYLFSPEQSIPSLCVSSSVSVSVSPDLPRCYLTLICFNISAVITARRAGFAARLNNVTLL